MKHIVLLHGLGSHGVTMRYLKAYIDLFSDYKTHAFSYYSITSNIEQITQYMEDVFNVNFSYSDDVCIIGHSLGGVIAAKLASSKQLRCKVSQIITLGSTHKGALLANKIMNKIPFVHKVFPIVEELSCHSTELEYDISKHCKVGVVAGNKHKSYWNPLIILGRLFLGDNFVHDGVVGLKENEMPCDDYVCLHVDHVNLLWSKAVAKRCLNFINTNKF
jgi:predicted alpha/beta hydrolase family esterase